MMTVKDKLNEIKEFYKPELQQPGTGYYTIFVPRTGVRHILYGGSTRRKVILGLGEQAESVEEAKAKGLLVVTERELFEALWPEEWEKIKTEVLGDPRSRNYLAAVRKDIGLIRHESGWDGMKFTKVDGYSIWMNLTGSGEVDVGLTEDGQWVAEFSLRVGIDDYTIESYIFERKPSQEDVITAVLCDDIENHMWRIRWNTSFRCWECGCKVDHWLDIAASSLETKFQNFKEHYCGC